MIYDIPESNVSGLMAEIAKLNKKAAKIGCSPIVATIQGERFETYKDNGEELTVKLIQIEVVGETPKFAGWTFAATLQHTTEGNIIRKTPTAKIDLSDYSDKACLCEHCNTVRRRNDTYILLHDSGLLKQVGSSCLKDFLGHANPHSLAQMAELIFSLNELCEGFEERGNGGGKAYYPVERILNFAAAEILENGYFSRAMAEITGKMTTADYVKNDLCPPRNAEPIAVSVEAETLAATAKEFVLNTLADKEELTEFENNLFVACKLEFCEWRLIGILCFVVEYYRRAMGQRKEKASKLNEFFGAVKSKITLDLTLVKEFSFDGTYGITYIYLFEDSLGRCFKWSTSNQGLETGKAYKVTGTIKAHDEYKGTKQTCITRCKIA
jgi:hypothetical protein